MPDEPDPGDDPLMAFRVLRYVTRIWDQYGREHPKARRLPAVIPLVIYQGPGRWTSPVQLLDVIDLRPGGRQAVQAWLPRFEFLQPADHRRPAAVGQAPAGGPGPARRQRGGPRAADVH